MTRRDWDKVRRNERVPPVHERRDFTDGSENWLLLDEIELLLAWLEMQGIRGRVSLHPTGSKALSRGHSVLGHWWRRRRRIHRVAASNFAARQPKGLASAAPACCEI
jgi:hypothetical protein